MNVREPRDFEAVKAQRYQQLRRHRYRRHLLATVCFVLAVGLALFGAYWRPLPQVEAASSLPSSPAGQVALSWPNGAQAAIGVQGQGVLSSTANQSPAPTASVAKIMLALAVIKKHPLELAQSGPVITINAQDVQRYGTYQAGGGSVVRVTNGQQFTEYQALQAVLLASANNLADTLAIWAYGSMDNYHQAANQLAQGLGMTQSKFAGDASGFSADTVSTPHDLVLLGQAAMEQPVLRSIVGQTSAEIPGVGTIHNTNILLGREGVIGIKTGNTDEAGGCFLFAAEHSLANGKKITAIGAIMGAPSIGQAMSASLPLLRSFYQGFGQVTAASKGTPVASYRLPWGQTVSAVLAQDITVLNWRGSKVTLSSKLDKITAPTAAQTQVGTLTAQTAYDQTQAPVIIQEPAGTPAWQWRVFRRNG